MGDAGCTRALSFVAVSIFAQRCACDRGFSLAARREYLPLGKMTADCDAVIELQSAKVTRLE